MGLSFNGLMEQPTCRRKILIVDDEPAIRDSLRLLLSSNYEIGIAEDGETALETMETFLPDLVLMDVNMPRLDGLETLSRLNQGRNNRGDYSKGANISNNHQIPIVMLSGAATVKSAVQAMKEGAVDYINKPFDITELQTVIARSLAEVDLKENQASAIKPTPLSNRSNDLIDINPQTEKITFNSSGDINHLAINSKNHQEIVGCSMAITAVLRNVDQVAPKDTTVLISGESGTGKELIARRIHAASSRSKAPFIAVNCAAIPESLIESELFGHEKGAFTSAVERRLGLCEMANRGTLFLDEIGELSLPVQVKLLRFLQEQEFYRVGGSKPVKVDVRIIAATNRNLEKAVDDKQFRLDLYYRLNVVSIEIPSLRERFEDVPLLLEHFRAKFAAVYNKHEVDFTPEAKSLLVQYSWPGNVRELQNMVESFMAISTGERITAEMLPKKVRVSQSGMLTLNNSQITTTSSISKTATSPEPLKFDEAERIFEIEMIVTALKKTDYVQTRAAELLGISRRILKYKMDKLGIPCQPHQIQNNQVTSVGLDETNVAGEVLDATSANQTVVRSSSNL